MKKVLCLTVLAWWLISLTAIAGQSDDLPLFDFEEAAALKAWTNLELPDAKLKEPAAAIERFAAKASSGKHSIGFTSKTKEIKNRPAVLVIYEPK